MRERRLRLNEPSQLHEASDGCGLGERDAVLGGEAGGLFQSFHEGTVLGVVHLHGRIPLGVHPLARKVSPMDGHLQARDERHGRTRGAGPAWLLRRLERLARIADGMKATAGDMAQIVARLQAKAQGREGGGR